MLGAYITIGILIAVLLLVGYAIVQPRLKRYRLTLRRVEPRKKRRAKPARNAKKRKSVWIRIV